MKKIIALLLVMCCFMTLFACKNESDGNGNQDTSSADKTASGENNAMMTPALVEESYFFHKKHAMYKEYIFHSI